MEYWDLYTADRQKTGQTMVRGELQPAGLYRLVVHVCIFNAVGELLIQQRQPFHAGWSNLWDVTVGGSAIAGESSQRAAERELGEELGLILSLGALRPALTVSFPGGFDDIYLLQKEVDLSALRLQPEEVQNVRWANRETVFAMVDAGAFIPYRKCFLELLFALQDEHGIYTKSDE